MKENRIIVTSALPYANGPIHCGHLVEYIQTDIFVRFLKLIGKNAVYCCADDTHGTPIEVAAQKKGILPEELISNYHKEHLRDFTNFSIQFDSYYSTNSKENKHFSELIFHRLNKNGFIYQKDVESMFCNKCKRFLPDRYIKGRCPKCSAEDQYGDVCEKCNATYTTIELVEPYCTICGVKPVKKISKHYFFKLGEFSDRLKGWLDTNNKLQPEIKNYVQNWIKEGLNDWDISRDGPYFGFKIPGELDKYFYVWLDAPIGYISSFANYLKRDLNIVEKEWNNSTIIHFIGKDITYFHFLFWPATLMGSGFRLPDYLVVHGFLTINGEKMSKSRGTFYTAEEFSKMYDPQFLRFYYAKVLSKKIADIDLDFQDFEKAINTELIGNLANFCYRTLNFIEKNFGSRIGKIQENKLVEKEILGLVKKIEDDFSDVNLNEALKNIMHISSLGNKFFQENEPWKLVIQDKEKAHKIVGFCANIVKIASIIIKPVLPDFSSEIEQQLNVEGLSWNDINFSFTDHNINQSKIIYTKIIKIEEQKLPYDLKVAKILSVEEHKDAENLYVLKIDLGYEKRQIVAGLKQYYQKKDLIGKKIILVANMKPAKLRGVESQGMLLAGDDGENIGLLTVKDAVPGISCTFGNLKNDSKAISFEEFSKNEMIVLEGKAFLNDMALKAGSEDIIVEKVNNGARIT